MTAVHRPTLLRRAAALLLLTAALVLGAALPSWASFTDEVAVPQAVSTATVAVPGLPSAKATCTRNTATVSLSWNASTAPRVSGYLVRVYLNDAWQDVTTVGPTSTTWQGTTDTFYVNNYSMTMTVWAQTQYGWTAESVRTARIVC